MSQYSGMFPDGLQSRRSHTDSVLDQGLRERCRREAIYSHQIILENSTSATKKSAKKKQIAKAKLLKLQPLGFRFRQRWLTTKREKRISTDQTFITEPNLGLLVRLAAKPIYWLHVVVKESTEFIAGRHARENDR